MAQMIYRGALSTMVVRARGILPAVRVFKIMAMPDTPPVTRPAGEAINATDREKVREPRTIESHLKILLYFIVVVFRKNKKIIGILEKSHIYCYNEIMKGC